MFSALEIFVQCYTSSQSINLLLRHYCFMLSRVCLVTYEVHRRTEIGRNSHTENAILKSEYEKCIDFIPPTYL